jgi:DNA-directed RNA polymerase subunit N (RpoN/RPB10)
MREFYNINTLTCIDLPVRCTVCNGVIGDKFYKWLEAEKKIEKKEDDRYYNKKIMEEIGLDMECCAKDVIAFVMYKKGVNNV